MAKKSSFLNLGIILIIIFIFSITGIVDLITDFYWFDNLGFSLIFTVTLLSKLALFFAAAFGFFAFSLVNLIISGKLSDAKKRIIPFKLKLSIVLALSIVIGLVTSQQWFIILQYLKQVPFGIYDPIFSKDIAFYIFSLPFFNLLWVYAVSVIIITTILVLLDYFQGILLNLKQTNFRQTDGQFNTQAEVPSYNFDFKDLFNKLKRKATIHLALLGSIFFVLLAIKHYLSRFSIMFSQKGIVVGAGYADVVAYLPMIKILMVLAIIVAVMFIFWIFFLSKSQKLKKRHILTFMVFLYLIFGLIGPNVITGVVQQFKVTPNEINLEKPYIENSIKFTKMAYGLTDVEERDFPVEQKLTSDILYDAKETIDNVRILDYRPLIKTYKQTQEIRLYYDLSGIDVDRYEIDGKYTQVMIAPRELAQNQIAEDAKTWVNIHMVYTHGYGTVMSPVNSVTKEGLPNYLIQDVPPKYSSDDEILKISRPEIYYGETNNQFVLVNTLTNEFDYPKGSTNVYANYEGKGGIILDSFTKKLLMAVRFKDVKILLSSDISETSKIMYIRNIQDRITKVTPFLALDDDPYLVISEGRLKWIQDAYTISNKFPYSEKQGQLNYIRNSVKIVMDAYDGTVIYYVIDTIDPLMRTYMNIFPDQFISIDNMPDDLVKHIRYPVDLFSIQSEVYNNYHMNDATVFYNKEDAWQIPYEIYGVGQKVKVEPYYVIMKIPGEIKEEFVLMRSFTPIKKDNMVSWMAARSDGKNYGKLMLFKFPKDKLIYGPLQIEAKIDQDSEISQQLTLWSQQGSQVTRGNLLIIPIGDSILYIEPLYIQAETGQLPELKRILVSDGERVVMEIDLATALETLFGKSQKKAQKEAGIAESTEDKTVDDLLKEANDFYDNILDGMNKQDWSIIGTNFDKLGNVLNKLNE